MTTTVFIGFFLDRISSPTTFYLLRFIHRKEFLSKIWNNNKIQQEYNINIINALL
ncbi:MAG: hypothetical protein WCJ62_03090 [Flavobacterium sp.]